VAPVMPSVRGRSMAMKAYKWEGTPGSVKVGHTHNHSGRKAARGHSNCIVKAMKIALAWRWDLTVCSLCVFSPLALCLLALCLCFSFLHTISSSRTRRRTG
jgi:hypothetical protein